MINKNIEDIIGQLESKGSDIEYKDELQNKAEELIKKDYSLEEALSNIAREVIDQTSSFLNGRNEFGVQHLTGISSCIYLPDFSGNGEYKLKIIGGTGSREIDLPVDENTLFDVASITKIFTLLLLFKLEQEKIIDLNDKISDINPEFKGLEDFTFNDLIRLHGIIYTNGRIDDAKSEEEALELLNTAYLKSNSREENNYTDLGAIIASKTLEKVISERLGKDMTYSDIMNEYLINPLGLNNTMFNPEPSRAAGNGNLAGLVHDPKARILGGAVGSAGIFTTSDDLAKLARSMFSLQYVNKDYLDKMGEITFPDGKFPQKGNFGMYVKHPLGIQKTFTPSEFSTGSFSHQGWTGPLAVFDQNNLIHENILPNVIYDDVEQSKVIRNKPKGFPDAFDEYLVTLTQKALLMLVTKMYYNKYYKVSENIETVERIR